MEKVFLYDNTTTSDAKNAWRKYWTAAGGDIKLEEATQNTLTDLQKRKRDGEALVMVYTGQDRNVVSCVSDSEGVTLTNESFSLITSYTCTKIPEALPEREKKTLAKLLWLEIYPKSIKETYERAHEEN